MTPRCRRQGRGPPADTDMASSPRSGSAHGGRWFGLSLSGRRRSAQRESTCNPWAFHGTSLYLGHISDVLKPSRFHRPGSHPAFGRLSDERSAGSFSSLESGSQWFPSVPENLLELVPRFPGIGTGNQEPLIRSERRSRDSTYRSDCGSSFSRYGLTEVIHVVSRPALAGCHISLMAENVDGHQRRLPSSLRLASPPCSSSTRPGAARSPHSRAASDSSDETASAHRSLHRFERPVRRWSPSVGRPWSRRRSGPPPGCGLSC